MVGHKIDNLLLGVVLVGLVGLVAICAQAQDCDNLPAPEWIAEADSLEVVNCVLIERANGSNWAWNDGIGDTLLWREILIVDTILCDTVWWYDLGPDSLKKYESFFKRVEDHRDSFFIDNFH